MSSSILVGPVMIPNFVMVRYHEDIGFFNVAFSEEQILKMKDRLTPGTRFNYNHSDKVLEGIQVHESLILTDDNRKSIEAKFSSEVTDNPNGTWIVVFEVPNEHLRFFPDGGGFSIQDKFTVVVNGKEYKIDGNFKRVIGLNDLLTVNLYIHGGGNIRGNRSEHGEGHFEVRAKNSNKKLGDIKIPTPALWKSMKEKEKLTFLTVYKGEDLSKRDKVALMHWLNVEENLKACAQDWNQSNKDNQNRAFQIPL